MNIWILSIVTVMCGVARGETTNQTVVPFGLESQNGNSNDGIIEGPSHFQELFSSLYLGATWQGPVMITGVAFRVADGTGSYAAVVPRVEIRLSTSSRTPESMSLLYSLNKGTDESTVYLHDNVTLSGSVRAGINPFDLRFTFDQPFLYNPSTGNLLMYMQTGQPTPGASQIDSHFLTSSSGARSFSYVGSSGPFADGQVVQDYSPVAAFSWVAIPEPTTFKLFYVAVVASFVTRRFTR